MSDKRQDGGIGAVSVDWRCWGSHPGVPSGTGTSCGSWAGLTIVSRSSNLELGSDWEEIPDWEKSIVQDTRQFVIFGRVGVTVC